MTTKEWWKRLKQCGWLAEVPAAEVDRIKSVAAEYGKRAGECGDVTLASGGFDSECIENSGDYKKWVVSAYVEASHGALKPTLVKDRIDWDEGIAEISLKVGGRALRRSFEQENDYVAEGVHEFMNEIVAALGEERRFHILPTDDQTVGIAFVRPATYARACELGVVPAQGEMGEDDDGE